MYLQYLRDIGIGWSRFGSDHNKKKKLFFFKNWQKLKLKSTLNKIKISSKLLKYQILPVLKPWTNSKLKMKPFQITVTTILVVYKMWILYQVLKMPATARKAKRVCTAL